MSELTRAVLAIQAKFWQKNRDRCYMPTDAEIEQVLRETMPKEDVTVERGECFICHKNVKPFSSCFSELPIRLLYHGGNGKWRLYCCGCVMEALAKKESAPESPLRERLAELVKFAHDHHLEHIRTQDVADLLTSGRGVDGARAGRGTGGRGESDSTIGLPPTSPTNSESAPPKGPDKEVWRVGSKVHSNVYSGDRPVCQCHSDFDAALIVAAVNKLRAGGAPAEPVAPQVPSPSGMAPPVSSDVAPDREGTGAFQSVALEQSAPPPEWIARYRLLKKNCYCPPATPSGYQPPCGNCQGANDIAVKHFAELLPVQGEQASPSCTVCGTVMVAFDANGTSLGTRPDPRIICEYRCLSCKTTTGCTEGEQASPPTPGDFLHALYCIYRGCKRCQELMERYPESPAPKKDGR